MCRFLDLGSGERFRFRRDGTLFRRIGKDDSRQYQEVESGRCHAITNPTIPVVREDKSATTADHGGGTSEAD